MKTKLHVYIRNTADFLQGRYGFCFAVSDDETLEGDGWILAGDAEINITADVSEVTKQAVAAVEEAEQKERAGHELKMNMLATEKSNLLTLTHEVK